MINLDVVIVNWNAGDQLSDCLLSLEDSCSGPDLEISRRIIVDNASADDSLDKLDRLPLHPLVIRNRENRGFGFGSNQGAKLGTGEYILFLNPDIKLYPGSLSKAVAFMEEPRNRSVGILGIQLLDESGRVQRNTARFPTPQTLVAQMAGLDRINPHRFPPHFLTDWDHLTTREVDQVQGAFFLVRRNLFELLQGFDESFFMYYEDVDFAFRARRAGWKSYYFADAQAFHRGGGTTEQIKAGRLFYWLRSRAQYVFKHFGRGALVGILIASLAIELWARIALNLIHLAGKHLIETLQAYLMYIRAIPTLLNLPQPEA